MLCGFLVLYVADQLQGFDFDCLRFQAVWREAAIHRNITSCLDLARKIKSEALTRTVYGWNGITSAIQLCRSFLNARDAGGEVGKFTGAAFVHAWRHICLVSAY